jgi:hypothetical protein
MFREASRVKCLAQGHIETNFNLPEIHTSLLLTHYFLGVVQLQDPDKAIYKVQE